MALTATGIRNLKPSDKPAGDKYRDADGMYLLVTKAGMYWRMDYRHAGKRKTLALGVYPTVLLAKARQRRDEARELLADGIDPSQAKRDDKQAKADAAANTFESVARTWMEKTEPSRAATTHGKLNAWLIKDVFPTIGSKPIADISPRNVLAMLQKVEARGTIDSAHQIKQLCGRIFRFAVASGWAQRDVTVDLKGALSAPMQTHYAAITEPTEAGALLRSIDNYTGHAYAAAALKLSPLVFLRPGELRSAEWSEIDLDAAQWRIPAEKMKLRIEHMVPLSTQAVAILRTVHPISGQGKYVFPSIRTSERCMSENTINAALRGMGYSKEVMTAHGFRAMARTIMDEVLNERVDLIEHQLAHAVKDPNGRAYNRTAHLPARVAMMQRWADYLDKLRNGADVVPIRANI